MKIVADESVDKQIVDRLRSSGHEVLFIAELDPGIDDEAVLTRRSRCRNISGASAAEAASVTQPKFESCAPISTRCGRDLCYIVGEQSSRP